MKMVVEGVYLGTELRVSGKGNRFNVILFQDSESTETMQVMTNENIDVTKLEKYKLFIITLDYSVRWKSFKVVEIEVLK